MSESHKEEFEGSVLEDVRLEEPSMFRVVMLNDDFTPQDFVVDILVSIYKKSAIDATRIMMDIHKKGRGVVGVFPYDIASTRVAQATRAARDKGFPLKSVIEKV